MFEMPDERLAQLLRLPGVAQASALIGFEAVRLAYANLGEAAVTGRTIDRAFFDEIEESAIAHAIKTAPLLGFGDRGPPPEIVPAIIECARHAAAAAFARTRQEHQLFGLDL